MLRFHLLLIQVTLALLRKSVSTFQNGLWVSPSLPQFHALRGSHFHRMTIQFEENESDERLRLLWDQEPFAEARKFIDAYIQENISETSEYSFLTKLSERDIRLVSSSIFHEPTYKEAKKCSFAIVISYRGSDFCGWQRQRESNIPSVQETLELSLERFQKHRVDVRVCGRTDAGVHALGQVCRFRTDLNISSDFLHQHINNSPSSMSLRCIHVSGVSSKFHPGFSATSRTYAYLIDPMYVTHGEVETLNRMLEELQNKTLNYFGFSYGKVKTQSTECTISFARALYMNNGALCIVLVGNRFLRRMVRILVATALKSVFNGEKSLLPRILTLDRKVSSRAAPPDGLLFVCANFN
jgi:tRNA pseudouridine(38-40) synthase